MAGTDFGVNHPQARKTWSADLFKEALKKTSVMQFMGKDSNSLVQIKSEVSKDAGDRIRLGLRLQLNGAGVAGDGILEGNEEGLEVYSQDVYIDQLRHAVRSNGKMSEQRVPFSIRAEARDGLADWWAGRFDTWFFNQITGNSAVVDTRYTGMQAATAPDTDHTIFPSVVTTEGSLSNTTACNMSLALIDAAVERSKLAQNSLRPIMVGNQKCYVLFLSPVQVTSLRTSTNTGQWLDIQKAAMSGGKIENNPIFTGALGMYNGVILHENTRVPTVATNVRRAALCGAQAALAAFGKGYAKGSFNWEEELFDYGNQLGVAAGCVGGMVKTRYNGSDFGTFTISTYDVAK